MKRALVWFKTDLRIADNETLFRASEWADQVIPVFCLENWQDQTTAFGTKRMGIHRFRFLLESLLDLDKQLRKLGSGLIICHGSPELKLVELAQYYGAERVYAKKEIAFEERQQLGRVESSLLTKKVSLELFSTSTLYKATDLPFSVKEIPDVFTSFRKKVEREAAVREMIEIPDRLHSPVIPPLDKSLQNASKKDSRLNPFSIHGGECQALERLERYFESRAVLTYKQTRDDLFADLSSSKFSPWLSLGCISSKTIYWKLKEIESRFGSNESTYWLYFELLWRDFFRFTFKKHNHKFFQHYGLTSHSGDIKHNSSCFMDWCNGETSAPLINAMMKELRLTGFISNRSRQIVASYLVYELECDWRYGAAWFEQELIDYDVSSNWGNWAYIAGVGNDPRGGRVFNIQKQEELYDKNKSYQDLWLSKY